MHASHVRLVFCGAFIALAAVGCGGGSPTDDDDDDDDPPNGNGGDPVVTTLVSVRDNNTFEPDYIRVSPGVDVTFTWQGVTAEAHNIMFTDPRIEDAADATTGTHVAQMPTQAGTYQYSCTNHAGMDGRILVQ
jgi:plastocyanin